MVAEMNPQMRKAVVKLQELSADERARDLYERREKALRDIDSRERWAEAKGRAEGKAEGRTEEREIWQNVVADKDAEIARLREQLTNEKVKGKK